MKVTAWSASEIGLVRTSNEDAVGLFADINLFLVADGLGGHEDGEIASRLAVEVISDRLRGADAMAATPDLERLTLAVQAANQRIFKEGARKAGRTRAPGTTVVALKVDPQAGHASWVHVGDSRLYRLRADELALLTADHTPFGLEYARQGFVPVDLPHSNALVQALGTSEHVDVATASAPVVADDLFLLCTDGVSGQMSSAALQEELARHDDLEATGQALIRLSLDGGGRDNASLVLVRVAGP